MRISLIKNALFHLRFQVKTPLVTNLLSSTYPLYWGKLKSKPRNLVFRGWILTKGPSKTGFSTQPYFPNEIINKSTRVIILFWTKKRNLFPSRRGKAKALGLTSYKRGSHWSSISSNKNILPQPMIPCK